MSSNNKNELEDTLDESLSSYDRRLSNFLGVYNFFPNNIAFRIKSSKSIEKWKNIQAFQLNQISNGKFLFPRDRRELLLLKYDLWSKFIYEIENLIIDLSHSQDLDVINKEQIDVIIDLANKTNYTCEKIILEEEKENFDQEFSKIWTEIHKLIYNSMIMKIRVLEGFNPLIVFTAIVDIVSSAMQYTLIEIHELDVFSCFYGNGSRKRDCVSCHDEDSDHNRFPFLIITTEDETHHEMTGKHLVVERFHIYRKYFDIKSVFFKNYAGHRIPKSIFEEIEKTGVEIEYKMNY